MRYYGVRKYFKYFRESDTMRVAAPIQTVPAARFPASLDLDAFPLVASVLFPPELPRRPVVQVHLHADHLRRMQLHNKRARETDAKNTPPVVSRERARAKQV